MCGLPLMKQPDSVHGLDPTSMNELSATCHRCGDVQRTCMEQNAEVAATTATIRVSQWAMPSYQAQSTQKRARYAVAACQNCEYGCATRHFVCQHPATHAVTWVQAAGLYAACSMLRNCDHLHASKLLDCELRRSGAWRRVDECERVASTTADTWRCVAHTCQIECRVIWRHAGDNID